MSGRRFSAAVTVVLLVCMVCAAKAATVSPSGDELRELENLIAARADEGVRTVTPAAAAAADLGQPNLRKIWDKPNILPCRQPDGSNPCWDGDYVFDQALKAGQTSPAVIQGLRRDFAAGRFTEGEICDGDIISNSGARDGRPFFIRMEEAGFDRAWLARKHLEHRTLPDGRICVPSQSYGAWHYVHACGNAVQLLARFEPVTDERSEPGVFAMMTDDANGAGALPGSAHLGGGGLGGFMSLGMSDEAPENEEEPGGEPRPEPEPGTPTPPPTPPLTPEGPPPPPAVVPAPAALWMLLTGVAALLVGARRRKAEGGGA